ncbi:conserved oligomeric Golgi complex subunit 3 [Folsomia candida]|uniref:conserved oligomeric Golgi complex subunit 3 n=1 Tax=Folsomia candida TaxID=158441 RepID=UPI000B8F614E|nr:conserved oligomeric Golgi complex subunit 3 [Folsomia candida]
MLTTSSPQQSPSLSRYKERIGQYEDSTNPLAPLTPAQRQLILDLTHNPVERPIPSHLKPIPKTKTLELKENSEQEAGVDFDKFEFTTKYEFAKWFKEVENDIGEEQDLKVLTYLESLQESRKTVSGVLGAVNSALDELQSLESNYHFVSNKTNALHNSCRQLIQEQQTLDGVAQELDTNLDHFLQLEKVASKLSVPTILVTSDAFFAILEQIDTCLSFMVHNPSFKESSVYAAKFKHCLNRALSLVKSEVNKALQETTYEITATVLEQSEGPNPELQTAANSLFPLIYGKFSAGISKMKKVFTEIEQRRNAWPEYAELFNEIQQSFLKERYNLLSQSVWATVSELNKRGKTGVDLCSTIRMGCSFCINLCLDEFRLFGDFFQPSYTVVFDEFADNLFTPIYESLRPLVIKIQHLETLAEICAILRVEMLQEQVSNIPQGLNSFINIVEQLLQDTQERLVYRAHIYISTDIRNYNPGPGDLAYPEKLEMMEQIAETIDQTAPPDRPLVRSNSQTSIISLSSVTSQEVGTINSQLQIPRPLKSSSSPADLHGMWFPSVRRTLLCLSKLHRCLDKAIFQGLSQEALIACIANVSLSAQAISSKKTVVDGQLFEIKHLLILREQIAPFQADFAVKETSLDFSRMKTAALSLLQKKKQVLLMNSNNSLLEFIVDGTPQVKEYFLDSKKEVDKQLKFTCEQFISHCTLILIGPVKNFITKASRIIEALKEKPDLVLSQQSFALPNVLSQLIQETMESLKSKLPFIHKSMKLYLANRETEFILFRPVKNNVLNGFLQLENIVAVYYSAETQLTCPTQDAINVLISTIMIQN